MSTASLLERPRSAARTEPRLPRMANAFAQLFLEVEAGLRPQRQLQRLMCPVLFARLCEVWVKPSSTPPSLLRLRLVQQAPGLLEAFATVDRHPRITALAFCLRRTADGWKVTDLARPEDGPLPPPAYPVPVDEPDLFDLLGL